MELDVVRVSGVPVPGVGPQVSDDRFVDMLQCSQKDLEVAVDETQKENLLLKSRCEERHVENLEMGKIMDGSEGIVCQGDEGGPETEGTC